MTEIIQYPAPEEMVTLEEVAGGFGLCAGLIIETARQKADELKDKDGGSKEDVKRSIKRLIQRAEVLMAGIDPALGGDKLSAFTGYFQKYTAVMNESIAIAQNNSMLAGMIDRYGDGIQTNMLVNGLIGPKTVEDIANIKIDYSNE